MRQVVVLVSGGLDGLLTTAVLRERGVAPRLLHLDTGFVHAARRRRIEALGRAGAVEVVDVRDAYLDLVRAPRHGHGSGLAACLDCRALMIRVALARSGPGRAVATGDVLGQRAMEQSRRAFETIDRDAGADGRVLRPLSAALLPTPAAIPWARDVDWPALHGRSRGGQRELAARLGLPFEPVPSGGCCRLADPAYARRLRDCLDHDPGRPDRECLRRLDVGRHIRLRWSFKAIAARDGDEGAWLEAHSVGCWTAQAADGRGALVVGEGRPDETAMLDLAAVAARYSASRGAAEVPVLVRRRAADGEERVVRVAPADDRRIRDGRL